MRRPSLLVVALLALGPAAPAQTLTHTAPWLGHTWTLELDGIPAGASYVVYGATAAWDLPTPFGHLGIDLTVAFPLGAGVADSQGTAALAIPLPQNAALAELPLHVQAFYLDAGSPAGGALVPARHLRLLGSRFYVTRWHASSGWRLTVVSSPSLAPVFDAPSPIDGGIRGRDVVVSPDGGTAVILTGDAVVRTDNFFGESFDQLELHTPLAVAPMADGEHALAFDGTSGLTLWRVPYSFAQPIEQVVPPVSFVGTAAAVEPTQNAIWVQRPAPPGSGARVGLVSFPSGDELDSFEFSPGFLGVTWIERRDDLLIIGLRGGTGAPFDPQAVGIVDLASGTPTPIVHALGFQGWQATRVAGYYPDEKRLVVEGWHLASPPVGPTAAAFLVATDDAAASPVQFGSGVAVFNGTALSGGGWSFLFSRWMSNVTPATLLDVDVPAATATPAGLEKLAQHGSAALAADFSGTRLAFGPDFGETFWFHDPASGESTAAFAEDFEARVAAVSIP